MASAPPSRALLESMAADVQEAARLRRGSSGTRRNEACALLVTRDAVLELVVATACVEVGLDVFLARTPDEARLAARAPFVRLVVVDQREPWAADLVGSVRGEREAARVAAVPVIAIGGDERRAAQAGAAAAFSVPVRVDELATSARWLLEAEAA